MKQAILITLGSALITGAAILAQPALAQDMTPEKQVAFVRTADLDLRSAAGQRQLDHRLANAAREVCGEASDVDLKGKNEVRRCRDETLASVKSQRETMFAAARRGAAIAVIAGR
jgi:UrcA family protein